MLTIIPQKDTGEQKVIIIYSNSSRAINIWFIQPFEKCMLCLHPAAGREPLSLALVWFRLVSPDHLVLFRRSSSSARTSHPFHFTCFEVSRWCMEATQSISSPLSMWSDRQPETSLRLQLQSKHKTDAWQNSTSSGAAVVLQGQVREETA